MTLIDDRGRLFGAVNVIDALVVLLVVAVVAAGATLVLSAPDSDTEQTRYATVLLEDAPAEVAAAVQPGNATIDARGSRASADVAVTDVYRVPTDGNVSTAVRLRVTGEATEAGGLAVDGGDLHIGDRVAVAASGTELGGRLLALDSESASLPVVERTVTVTATVPASVAESATAGDAVTVAGETVATVEHAAASPAAEDDQRRLELTLTVHALERQGGPWFGEGYVRLGADLPVRTDEYALTGAVTDVRDA